MKTPDTHVHAPTRRLRAATLAVLVAAWLPLSDAGARTAFGQPQSVSASGTADIRAMLDRYCVGCHNERLLTGGLALDTLDAANPAAAPERWERVIQKLRTGTMPPAGRPRPARRAGVVGERVSSYGQGLYPWCPRPHGSPPV